MNRERDGERIWGEMMGRDDGERWREMMGRETDRYTTSW